MGLDRTGPARDRIGTGRDGKVQAANGVWLDERGTGT